MALKDSSNTDLLTRIAWLYHKGRMTQDKIALRLNISRSKVVRLLKKGRGKWHYSCPYPKSFMQLSSNRAKTHLSF